MDREALLRYIAPCSLMCYSCAAYQEGIICESAKQLKVYLEGMDGFYEKCVQDQMEDYTVFERKLKDYASASCDGCRNGRDCKCSTDGCFVLSCSKEHRVDFCAQCSAFPCEDVKEVFDGTVYEQWLKGNQEIKEIGIQEYWVKNRRRPHYNAYVKKGESSEQ